MIPARLNSTRLPGKLMMDLNGIPIILSTLLNTIKTNLFDDVYVVTDSKEIYTFLIKHHKNILFSKKNHDSGSDRIAEFAKEMQVDIIVNVQGDEPLIDPKNIDKVINFHKKNLNSDIILPTLVSKKKSTKNIVKVLINNKKEVMYLSRTNLPFNFKKKND